MDYSQRTERSRPLSDNRRSSRSRVGGSYLSGRSGGGNRYELKSRNIRFRGKSSSMKTRFAGLNPRQIMFIVLGVVLAILVIFLVSSCVRSCKSNKPETSEIDARVAAGVSDELVDAFTPVLDQAEALQWIAAHANEYPSEDLPRLALSEPAAIAFVRAYPEMSKSGSAFDGTVSRGVCQVDGNGYLTTVKEMRKIARTADGIQNDEDGMVTPLTGEEPVSMNFWGFSPRFFDTLGEMFAQFLKDNEGNIKAEFPIPDAVSAVMASGDAKVRVLPTKSEWFGVTYAEDRPMVVEKLKSVSS